MGAQPLMEEGFMDQQTFEAGLKRDGYDVMTNTTPGVKVNPEHSHPFDVKALVLKGALTLNRDGGSQTYRPGEMFSMPRGCLHYESYGAEGAVVLLGRKF
jgi:quercetin dioxygenase-like cupin family protein